MSDDGVKSLDEIWNEMNVDDGLSLEDADSQVIDVSDFSDDTDQPDSDEFVPAKLSDFYAETDEEDQPSTGGVADLDQEITLPNGTRATVRELWESGLRLEDYTRKTQEVAETRRAFEEERSKFDAEREQLEAARALRQALLDDPTSTVARMAVELGIIDEETARFAGRQRYNGDASKLLPDTGKKADEVDIEALIEQKAAEKFEEFMKNSPVAKEIEMSQARQQVDSIFGQIEQAYGTKLDQDDRKAILQASIDLDQDNLEYVYLKLNSELQKRQANKNRVRQGSANASVGSVKPNDADRVTTPPETFDEAWRRVELKYA